MPELLAARIGQVTRTSPLFVQLDDAEIGPLNHASGLAAAVGARVLLEPTDLLGYIAVCVVV